MSEALDRLARLLDQAERERDEAKEELRSCERELEGSLNGWRRGEGLPDDEALPLPRLELAYVQIDGWDTYSVKYRMVAKHLLGHVMTIPLGETKTSGGLRNEAPNDAHLPFRDGAHIAHDSAHFQMPAYKIVPGRKPERLVFNGWDQVKRGSAHRREVGS